MRNTPRLVFLCGGRLAKTGNYLSARDYFYRHLQRQRPDFLERLRLAEDISDWFGRDQAFPDLLELEVYLADLAEIIILFVESAGSIAELGAFAVSDELRPKTLAVLNQEFDLASGFIGLGPVRKIENDDASLVHYYNWKADSPNSQESRAEFRDMSAALLGFLDEREDSAAIEQSLKLATHGHRMLVIADLVRISGVATLSDIEECLEILNCRCSRAELERYASLIVNLGFVQIHKRANQRFYASGAPTPYVVYDYLPNAALNDERRIQTEIRKGLTGTRKQALRAVLKKAQHG